MTTDDADFFSLMIANSAAGRALHYRSEADRLRKLAEAEPNPRLRQNLLELVKQYADLAASLDSGHKLDGGKKSDNLSHVKYITEYL